MASNPSGNGSRSADSSQRADGSHRADGAHRADGGNEQDVYARAASAAASRPASGARGEGDERTLATRVSEKVNQAGRRLGVTDEPGSTALLRSASDRRDEPVGSPKVVATEVVDENRQRPGIRRTRKARLRLSRLDPWSVMKTAFMFSIAAGIVMVVAVYAIWTVVNSSGIFDNLNGIIADVISTPGDTTPFRIEDYVNTPKVMGVTAFLAVIDVVIFTALLTLGSFLYNLAATMLGGLEVTLAED